MKMLVRLAFAVGVALQSLWLPAMPIGLRMAAYGAAGGVSGSYTLTFDANGGIGGKSVVQGYGTSITAPKVVREGYTFTGWSPEVDASVPASNVTYVAQWQINKYKVTFNANGGAGGSVVQAEHGSSVGELPTPSRGGYVFDGWWTKTSGGVRVTEDTVVSSNATYYAHWKKTYAITVYPNGSGATLSGEVFGEKDGKSATAKITVVPGETLGNKIGVAVRKGYVFLGWYTQRDAGGVVFDANGSCKVGGKYWDKNGCWKGTANLKLYAHWAKAYTITVYPNGGSGATLSGKIFGASDGKQATAKITVAAGETLNNKIGVAVRNGYVFLGWYTGKKDGGVVFYDDGSCRVGGKYWTSKGTWKGTADLKLYAHWAKAYTVKVYPNGSGSTLVGEIFGKSNGKSSTATVTVAAGETLNNKIGTAVRPGYKFLGWYTQRSAGGVVFDVNGNCKKGGKYWTSKGTWKGTANLNLYAHWEKVSNSKAPEASVAAVSSPVADGVAVVQCLVCFANGETMPVEATIASDGFAVVEIDGAVYCGYVTDGAGELTGAGGNILLLVIANK